MKNKLKNKKLKTQMIAFAVLVSLAITLVSVFCFAAFIRILATNNEEYFNTLAKENVGAVDNIIEKAKTNAYNLSTNESVVNYFSATSMWERDVYKKIILANIEKSSKDLEAMFILSKTSGVMFQSHRMSDDDFLSLLFTVKDKMNHYEVFPAVILNRYSGQPEYIVFKEDIVYNAEKRNNYVIANTFVVADCNGALKQNGKSVDSLVFATGGGTAQAVAYSEKEIADIFLNQKEKWIGNKTGSIWLGVNQYNYVVSDTKHGEWKCLTVQKTKYALGLANTLVMGGIIVVVVLVLCTLAGIFVIVRNFTQPIEKIMADIDKVTYGNYKYRLNVSGYEEIAEISRNVNSLIDALHGEMRKVAKTQMQLYEAELLRKDSELVAMRCQINPHFLYNTLECVRSIAWSYNAYEVTDIVSAVVQIFRYNTSAQNMSTLREELECCKSYAQIIEIRFMSKYTFSFYAEEALLDMEMPKMILQPIAENAVIHGLERKAGKGEIVVSAKRIAGDMQITVSDTGAGLDTMALEKLRLSLKDPAVATSADPRHTGVGLKNVDGRLRFAYGEGYGLLINSQREIGTTITVCLPAVGDENV